MATLHLFFLALMGLQACTVVQASPAERKTRQAGPVTCPGFPGYCSESNPGDTCFVVCAFGRNNVPECQEDGTWTDAPRCIEHEPGIPEQVPGLCPGIPGYCSTAHPGALCEFDCVNGPDIRSTCTPDGTWFPYPTCDGDIRETKDGCDPCPGPFGGPRDRSGEGQGGGAGNVNTRLSVPQPPPQPARPARPAQSFNSPNVIQPARQTGFSPAPQPAILANSNRNNNRNSNRANNNNINSNRRNNNRRNNNNNNGRRNNNFRGNSNRNNNSNVQRFEPAPQTTPAVNPFQSHNNNSNRFNAPPPPQSPPAPISPPAQPVGGDSRCPGGLLENCIDVCPSFSARIFGACVAGCARRCPNRK